MYHTVKTGKLLVGSTIRIKKSYVRGIRVVLDDFDITGRKDVADTCNLPFLLHFDTRDIYPQPLYALRSYYLNPWLADIPYGNKWTNVEEGLTAVPSFKRSSCISLKELEKLVSRTSNMKGPFPDLLVTVLHPGEFRHYGRPGSLKECPFKGHLLLSDHTAICGAILWDKRNTGTHWHIKPGDNVLLKDYTTCVNYTYKRYRHRYENPGILALEITLNHNSVINFVKDDDVPVDLKRQWYPLPYPVYRFVPRNLLGRMHHGKKVDVVGYVTYVGHIFGVDAGDQKFEGHQRITFQWVEMLDDTSKYPIRMKLHFSYQLNEQESITPGQLLACTHLRIVHQNMDSSFGKVNFYLKSTNESLILFDLPKEVMREKRIQEFLQWVKKNRDELQQIQILFSRVGGFTMCRPEENRMARKCMLKRKPVNRNIPQMKPNSKNVMFLHGEHWKCEMDNLEVRECKSVVVCGSVTEVTYLRVACKCMTKEHLYMHSSSSNDCVLLKEKWQLAFPRLFLLDFKEELQKFLQLPAFSSEQIRSRPLTKEQLEELPFFLSEGYIVVIKSDCLPVSISTVFFPRASQCPHPSLENLLKKEYQTREPFSDEECYIETATYVPEQNDRVKQTAKEIECKNFLFKLDFYCFEGNHTVAILNRAL